MREGFRHHVALRALLEAVVADGSRCVEAFLDVPVLKDLGGGIGLLRPDAGEAVGLEFHAHRQRVGIGLGGAHAGLGDLVGDAEQVLHMVANLMRDHIGLGEIARCAELVLHVLVEGEVDVDLLVGRAIERAHGGLGAAAG